MDYANWGINQPDNLRVSDYSLRGQHFVAVHKLLRYWDDSDGQKKLAFLCECPGWESEEDMEPTGTPETPEDGVRSAALQAAPQAKGKRFIYYPVASSFWKAQSRCVNSGDNLACPSNARQNEFIANLIRGNTWLGVLDFMEGQWKCSSSEELTYTNWGLNQPDNKVGTPYIT